MGLILDDGQGGEGGSVGTKQNRLKTYGVMESEQLHVNEDYGEAYSVLTNVTPTAAGDCFLYIKNNSDNDLLITSFKLQVATDETIQVKLGDSGTAVGGGTITPVNRNAGSGKQANATVEGGVDITGLSGGSVVDQLNVDGASGTRKYSWTSTLLVPKNSMISFYAVTGGIALVGTVSMYYHV